jgi:hypothetical protein
MNREEADREDGPPAKRAKRNDPQRSIKDPNPQSDAPSRSINAPLSSRFSTMTSRSVMMSSVSRRYDDDPVARRRDFANFRETYLEIMTNAEAITILKNAAKDLKNQWNVDGMVIDGDEGMAMAIKNELGEEEFVPDYPVSNAEIPVLYSSNFENEVIMEGEESDVYTQSGVITIDEGMCVRAIGRIPGTDFYIDLPHDTCISRICFVIIVVPGKAIVVMDMGSISGIKTLSRQRDLPLVHSTEEERRFLYFSWGERAVLELAEGRRFAFYPKECIVCMTEPRGAVVFQPCQHCVCCDGCAEKIKQREMGCPVCRGDIEKVKKGIDKGGQFQSRRGKQSVTKR